VESEGVKNEMPKKSKPTLKIRTIKAGSKGPMIYDLAEGVEGYAIEEQGRLFIPVICAKREGNGDVGRFLDCLPANAVIPNVTSDRLAGMLVRRGWKPHMEIDDRMDEAIDVWTREKKP
jgi:hypothetical protein